MWQEAQVQVPRGLRVWFVVHFILDFLLGAPLLLAPVYTLTLFGWKTIDPLATRLVGAALMGIGVESLLGRNASADTYRAMLNLKLIWSGCAVLGLIEGLRQGGPPLGWVLVGVFALFFLVWCTYRIRLRPQG